MLLVEYALFTAEWTRPKACQADAGLRCVGSLHGDVEKLGVQGSS